MKFYLSRKKKKKKIHDQTCKLAKTDPIRRVRCPDEI